MPTPKRQRRVPYRTSVRLHQHAAAKIPEIVRVARASLGGEARAAKTSIEDRRAQGTRGGRPKVPSACPRCGEICDSRVGSLAHCKARSGSPISI